MMKRKCDGCGRMRGTYRTDRKGFRFCQHCFLRRYNGDPDYSRECQQCGELKVPHSNETCFTCYLKLYRASNPKVSARTKGHCAVCGEMQNLVLSNLRCKPCDDAGMKFVRHHRPKSNHSDGPYGEAKLQRIRMIQSILASAEYAEVVAEGGDLFHVLKRREGKTS